MRNKRRLIRWLSDRNSRTAAFILKRYEVIAYLLFGFLTTIVNVGIFTFLEHILGQSKWYMSNFPAIMLAILFAYVTNRSFVFDSDGNFWFEMLKFFSARIIVSLIFEYGAIYLMYDILGFDAQLDLYVFSISWFKIISMILVLITNYIASKIFVFKKNKDEITGERT